MNNRFANIQNTKENLDAIGPLWTERDFSHPERTIRLGTSFSGIGAIEHAMKRLGLNTEIMFAGDIDADCKISYQANYGVGDEKWHTDIHDFDAKPFFGNIDLFVGGAPCQAFSMRGKRGGFEDTRGTLFREFARIVMECRPKVFIFENVRGLLNHAGGRTWSVIRQTFERDCDYQVYFQELNGKDYGIPQSRDRVFCIGFREPREFKYPAPIGLQGRSVYDFLDKQFSDKYLLKQKGVTFVSRKLNYEKSYTQINGEVMLCQKRNQQFNWHGDFIFHPLTVEQASSQVGQNTVFDTSLLETTYYLNSTLSNYTIEEAEPHIFKMMKMEGELSRYGCFRKLTPRECLRLMGFDDSFAIRVSDTAIYKQAGNSIIVDILMALLREMDITQYGV